LGRERASLPPVGSGSGRSQKVHLVIVSVLATLIPLVLFTGFWIRHELAQSQRDMEQFLSGRAEALSQRLDGEIKQQLVALKTLSALPSLEEQSLAGFYAAALRVATTLPDWAVIGVVDPTGRQLLNTGYPFGANLEGTASADVLQRVTTTRGPIISSGDKATPFYDKRGIVMYLPVVREGEVRFIIVAALKPDGLQKLVQQAYQGNTLAVLVDERQHILARSRAADRFVGEAASDAFRTPTQGRTAGLFHSRTLDDQDVSSAFIRSPLTGWVALVSMDSKEFNESARRSLWASIIAGALSVTLAGILAVFLFHNVMERRVSDERLAASQALGELDARLLATAQEALGEQRKAASEREVLLREIYHRVKNNLQIVQSLLRLGSRDLKPGQREPFENAVRRIGAMARVHTLLYNSPDLASIDFRDYLDELTRETSEAFGASERGITTVLKAESMRVSLDTAVPLAFIAVEILTNAFRHAFPEGRAGTITVRASKSDHRGWLEISDDGVGLPREMGSRRPLGLTIVSKLVQQIDGTLQEPEPGGSVFRVSFPLDEPHPEEAGAVPGAAPLPEARSPTPPGDT